MIDTDAQVQPAGGSEFEAVKRLSLKERHPDWPNVKLSFFFGPHFDANDFDDMRKSGMLQNADIYCYEHVYGPRDSAILNQAAQRPAPQSPQEVDSFIDYVVDTHKLPQLDPILESRIRAVYGTGIVVGHFDIDPAKGDSVTGDDIFRAAGTEWFRGGTYDEILQDRLVYEKRIWELNAQRERIMLAGQDEQRRRTAGRFEEELARILRDHPELREKETLTVVVSMGSKHADGLLALAEEAGLDVEATYTPDAKAADFGTGQSFARGETPSRDALARGVGYRVFAGGLERAGLAQWLQSKEITGRQARLYLHKTMLQLNADDIEKLFAPEDGRSLEDIIDPILEAKGLSPFPRSPQGLLNRLHELSSREENAVDTKVTREQA